MILTVETIKIHAYVESFFVETGRRFKRLIKKENQNFLIKIYKMTSFCIVLDGQLMFIIDLCDGGSNRRYCSVQI